MLSPYDFFMDMMNPMLAFLPRALLMAIVSAILCGVVGTHVVLRGMAFIGDAVAHAVFPGLAVAFVVGGSLVVGGAIAGISTAIMVAILSQNRRLKEDSIIGVLFVAAFALGIVILSFSPGYAGSLQDFLFGSITGIPAEDVPVAIITTVVVIAVLAFFHKEIVAVTLDRESARAAGLPVMLFDIIVYSAVSVAIVISVQTIGNVLVLALLITPAATARLLTDRLFPMMILGPIIGAIASFLGVYISWSIDLPTGGSIVLVLTVIFALSWVFAPRHGVIARRRASKSPNGRDEDCIHPDVIAHNHA